MSKNKTGLLLEPIPETNNYLIIRYNPSGKIIDMGVRTNDELIEGWAKKHINADLLCKGLRCMAEIEMYDD